MRWDVRFTEKNAQKKKCSSLVQSFIPGCFTVADLLLFFFLEEERQAKAFPWLPQTRVDPLEIYIWILG